jgi:hypothetical protein
MKTEELVQKIKSQTKLNKSRKKNPIVTFLGKVLTAEELLKEIENKIIKKELINEARTQYVIALVTAFEVYFKDLLIYIFDNCKREIVYDNCNKIKFDEKYSFIQLLEFYKNKIEIQEIIRVSKNFQNIDIVFDVFGNLTGMNLSKEIENYTADFHRLKVTVTKELKNELIQLLKKRHELTHEIDGELNIKKDETDDYFKSMIIFIVVIDKLINKEFISKNLIG